MFQIWQGAAAAGAAFIAMASLVDPVHAADDFPTIVRAILDSQTDGPLSEMDADRRSRMTDCVIATLDALPDGKKRLVLEGATLDEQEHRFGQVVDENHAKWRQNIAKACAEIAVGD